MKKIFKKITFICTGLVFVFGVSYVTAGTYNSAPTPPTTQNTDFPLTIGTTDQTKNGDLSVAGFLVNQPAEIDGQTFFSGILRSKSNTITIASDTSVSGDFSVNSYIQSESLSGGGDNHKLCIAATGTVILCP